MERKDLESAAANVVYLRGLLALPTGALFAAAGLGNLRWGPFRSNLFFIGFVALLALAAVGLTRYYNDYYGRVAQSARQQVAYAVVLAIPMVGGSILDSRLDLPVSLFTGLFAVAMLVWMGRFVGLRSYHWIVWGALLVAAVTPWWGSLSDKVSVALVLSGVATMTSGLLDHQALIRRFGRARENVEHRDLRV
jgi:hypothetical protein